jgi:hypothetical protein
MDVIVMIVTILWNLMMLGKKLLGLLLKEIRMLLYRKLEDVILDLCIGKAVTAVKVDVFRTIASAFKAVQFVLTCANAPAAGTMKSLRRRKKE